MRLSYVLPIRTSVARLDLVEYLEWLAGRVEVIVVDGSDDGIFAEHHAAFGPPIRHLLVDPERVTPMGKVSGVMTGVMLATHDHVVIADDDIFYTDAELRRLDLHLDSADVIRPQNWYEPLPWHARWDTGRMLLNRMVGGDWPGTLGIRRSTLLQAGGYAGDVLFENLELVRTIESVGGRAVVDLGLLVRRQPPSIRQFLDQRVRQAYDEFARPWRLLAFLALGPSVVFTRGRSIAALAVAAVGLAEMGRRRAGGRRCFRPTAALWAPLWLMERSVTSWLALFQLVFHGGVRYRGGVLRRAATPRRELRRRLAAPAGQQGSRITSGISRSVRFWYCA